MNSFFYSIGLTYYSAFFHVKHLLTDPVLMLLQQTVAMHMHMSMHVYQMMLAEIN